MKKIIGIVLCVGAVVMITNTQKNTKIDLGTPPVIERYKDVVRDVVKEAVKEETDEIVQMLEVSRQDMLEIQEKADVLEHQHIQSIRRIPEILERVLTELKFFADVREKTQKWFSEMASITVREEMKQTQKEEYPVWKPEERQVILFFYPEDNYDGLVKRAQELSREGHVVYRAAPTRYDLYAQFDVAEIPLWLVIRDGEVIYRDAKAPTFPAQKQRQTSLDDKYEAMSRALQRKDSFGIQHVSPGTGRYQTQRTTCTSGVCSW